MTGLKPCPFCGRQPTVEYGSDMMSPVVIGCNHGHGGCNLSMWAWPRYEGCVALGGIRPKLTNECIQECLDELAEQWNERWSDEG